MSENNKSTAEASTINQTDSKYFKNVIATTDLLKGSINYKTWVIDVHNILDIHNLCDYVYEEKIIKIDKSKIESSKLSEYKPIKYNNSYVYDKSVTDEMIQLDKYARLILTNSMAPEVKSGTNYNLYTSYEIWNMLKISHEKNREERKREIKAELEHMRYSLENDISRFISKVEDLFCELSNLNVKITDNQKYDLIYNMMPRNVARDIGLTTCEQKWTDCKKKLLSEIPKLKYYKELRERTDKEIELNKALSSTTNRNKMTKCNNCGNFGHYQKNCRNNNYSNNNNNRHKQYNNNRNNNYNNRNNNNNKYNNNKFNNNNNYKFNNKSSNNNNNYYRNNKYSNNKNRKQAYNSQSNNTYHNGRNNNYYNNNYDNNNNYNNNNNNNDNNNYNNNDNNNNNNSYDEDEFKYSEVFTKDYCSGEEAESNCVTINNNNPRQ